MMSTKKKMDKIKVAVAWGCGVLALSDVTAADSTVPYYWNVAPMTNGAYREAFEAATLPDWANKASNVLSNLSPTVTGVSRSNTWFGAGTKVLQLDTAGTVVTNTLSYTNATAVSYASRPVYVDMKVRFEALPDEPDAALLASSKLAVYVSSDLKLVVAHDGGTSSNAYPLGDAAKLTNDWHQLTVRITNGLFNVYLNDLPVVGNLVPKGAGTSNQLDAASFWGTGFIDDLYVSHGDPKYPIAGPTGTMPDLPPAGSNPPTDEEQTRINVWLDGQNVTVLSMTQDQLSQAYLVNAVLSGTPATAPAISFGLSAIDVISTTQVRVTVKLTVGAGDKAGTINGRVQLLASSTKDGTYSQVGNLVSPTFAGGKADVLFTTTEEQKFFKAKIVP